MKKQMIFYYISVFAIFVVLIFSVRHLVNTTRIFVGNELGFNPVYIQWDLEENDSTLRIKDPIYLRKEYFLIDYHDMSFIKEDSTLYADLFNDSVKSKGNALNIQPPYFIWKEAKNDTLKIYQRNTTLKFVKREIY